MTPGQSLYPLTLTQTTANWLKSGGVISANCLLLLAFLQRLRRSRLGFFAVWLAAVEMTATGARTGDC